MILLPDKPLTDNHWRRLPGVSVNAARNDAKALARRPLEMQSNRVVRQTFRA